MHRTRKTRRTPREATAYHEAGHWLACVCQGERVISLSIDPPRCQHERVVDEDLTPEDVRTLYRILTAGPMAERLYYGKRRGMTYYWFAGGMGDYRQIEHLERISGIKFDQFQVEAEVERWLVDMWEPVELMAGRLLAKGEVRF